MSKRKKYTLLFSGIGAMGLLAWRYEHMQPVKVHVGEAMQQILQDNPRKDYDPNKYTDQSSLIWPQNDLIGGIFDFTYNDPQGAIRLPHARMIWMRQYAGTVFQIDVNDSKSKLTLPEFVQELNQVAAQLRAAGWIEKNAPPSLSSLQSSLSNTNGSMANYQLAGYVKGDTSAVLEMDTPGETVTPGTASRASFVLNVEFANDALGDREGTRAYNERLKVNGSIDKPLPLSYWFKHR